MSKILLVTGASSDVGSALIERVVVRYDKVICHYRNSIAKIEALQSKLGDKVLPLQADFANERSSIDFTETVAEYEISHFVHIPAVMNENKKFAKTAWGDFNEHIGVEVRSAYLICSSLMPQMSKSGYGKVVFMLTENVARQTPGKFAVPYTVSKYALLGLMKCLAAEYVNKGITVNGVSPSMIETNFVSNLPELARKMNADKSPAKHNLTPNDVIGTFEYLLSEASDRITGLNIPVGMM
jgi:3-oxoacyl-[acyl-carrier protein] reductase